MAEAGADGAFGQLRGIGGDSVADLDFRPRARRKKGRTTRRCSRASLWPPKVTRLGEPRGVAAIAAFVLSAEAEWINGRLWYIGGASHMRE